MADANTTTETLNAQREYWNCVCIPLTKGYHTIIDIDDFPFISSMKWHVGESRGKTAYAKKMVMIGGQRKSKSLHQFLFNKPMDHRDNDGLNNRRSNLRPCTGSQNQMNQGVRRGKKSSRFKGVSWNVRGQKWEAYINVERKRIKLGRHSNEIDAAKAYNQAAAKYHGDFASFNPV